MNYNVYLDILCRIMYNISRMKILEIFLFVKTDKITHSTSKKHLNSYILMKKPLPYTPSYTIVSKIVKKSIFFIGGFHEHEFNFN